jgi:polysaccharide deacetylase 2 family uncharacterized protein YibQ
MSSGSTFPITPSEAMSEAAKPGAPSNAVTPEQIKLPHSWILLGSGFVTSICIALAVIILVLHYRQTRPADLKPVTGKFIEETQGIFKKCRIPDDAIHMTGPVDMEDAKAFWRHAEFEVTLPETMSGDGLIAVVTDWAEGQRASVSVDLAGELEQVMHLQLRSKEFATLRIIETPIVAHSVPVPAALRDLSPATNRVSDEILALIREFGAPPPGAEVVEREKKEDASSSWTNTRIAVTSAVPIDADALAKMLHEKFAGRKIELKIAKGGEGAGPVLTALYDGIACTDIALPADAAPTPGPLELEPLADSEPHSPAPDTLVEPQPPVATDAVTDQQPQEPITGGTTAPVRIAIIIDDGGRAGKAADAILALDPRLTVSILPYEPQSAEIAERARKLGFEVMLHMPMEPEDASRLYPDSITTKMRPDEVSELTERALDGVPGAVGVNNHEGSLTTANQAAMRAFFNVVSKHKLFFIDSRTTTKTVAYDVAVQFEIPANKRDVFLDNKRDFAHIEERFNALLERAREQGSAIAIGHFSVVTAEALSKLLPRLGQEGAELVHASELVH